MKRFSCFLVVLLIGAFCFCSCALSGPAEDAARQKLTVVSWNVQTFFDGQKSGNEYSEFFKSDIWDERMYLKRVERLSQVIIDLDADVYVLQEIENASVIQDICNQLVEKVWKNKDNWTYSCFCKNDESSIGCAVISKYPIEDLSTHMIDIRTTGTKQPDMRPIMKMKIVTEKKFIDLFVNHWKSKTGNALESETWRSLQEALLASLLRRTDEDYAGIICGDFNKDIDEFTIVQNESGNILLHGDLLNCPDVCVYSPWLDENGKYDFDSGSYYYKNAWERIDNIFSYGNVKILDFEPCTDPRWTTENGTPYSYKIYTGEGYSDHLPIKACIIF